jgi:hypothetical protein
MDERGLLAHHEAGHAVAAVLVGGAVRSVALAPPVTEASFRGVGVRDELVVWHAGDAAVGVLKGRERSAHDAAAAAVHLARHRLSELDRIAAVMGADALLRRHWGAVAAIARRLLERGRLSGAEVAAVIDATKKGSEMSRDVSFAQWVEAWKLPTFDDGERVAALAERARAEYHARHRRNPATTADWGEGFDLLTAAIKAEHPAPADARLLLAALVVAARGCGLDWQGGGSPW